MSNPNFKTFESQQNSLEKPPVLESPEIGERKKQYFPIILISAPHIAESFPETPNQEELDAMPKWRRSMLKWKNQHATALDYSMYPGEPTPLRYASAVLEHELKMGSFPAEQTPEITAVLNPPVFNHQFVNRLIYKLTTEKPKVAAISNLSESHPYALIVSDLVRQYSPETVVIMGGQHETGTHPKISEKENRAKQQKIPSEKLKQFQTLQTPEEQQNIDFVVSGDGQYAFLELIKLIAENPRASREEIKKLAKTKLNPEIMQGEGFISFADPDTHIEGERQELVDIHYSGKNPDYSALPYIGRDLLYVPNYYPIFLDEKGKQKLTAQVMLQHGCFENCSFCAEGMGIKEFVRIQNLDAEKHPQQFSELKHGMSLRVAKIIEELKILANSGYRAIFFDDSTFLQNRNLVEPFLETMIVEKQKGTFDFEWGCQTTLQSFDAHVAEKMKAAGCTYVYFGVENKAAGKFNISKARRKNYSYNTATKDLVHIQNPEDRWVAMFENALKACEKTGIRMGSSLQFGFEGETMEDRKQTIDMLAEARRRGVLKTVALNINTTYPRTGDWINMLRSNWPAPDWRKPLTRHPMYETFTENSSLTNQQKIEKIKQLLRISKSEKAKQYYNRLV